MVFMSWKMMSGTGSRSLRQTVKSYDNMVDPSFILVTKSRMGMKRKRFWMG